MAVIGRPAPPSKLSTGDIADNAITSAKIADNVITHADVAPNAITASELADDAVDIAALSASGTADNTTFLRGDNSWQIVDTEGTGIKSTGESGGSKFLREDGDGTSSWQEAGSPSITDNGNSNAMTIDSSENVTLVESLTTPSLKQNSNQNLSGTYSAHQLFIADGYTLTGNITVNETVALTKLSDDGNSITLTTDGNSQTITGSGSLEASTIAQTPVTSLTGMTGELGSAITGSPNLNLSNATFPAGKVINFKSKSGGNTGSQAITTSWTDSEKGAVTYTVVSPTSKIYVQWNCHFQVENDASNYRMMGSLRSSVDSYASNLSDSAHEGTAPLVVNYSSPAIYLWIQHVQPVTAFHAHGQPAGTTISYKMYFQGSGSVSVYSWDTWGTSPSESVTFMEVEQ